MFICIVAIQGHSCADGNSKAVAVQCYVRITSDIQPSYILFEYYYNKSIAYHHPNYPTEKEKYSVVEVAAFPLPW